MGLFFCLGFGLVWVFVLGFFGGRGEYNKNISVKQQLKKRLIGDVLHSEGPWVVYLYRKDWGVGGWEVPKS